MAQFAVFYQETGEEGIMHFQPGETLEQLLERAPDEWRFRHVEKDYATQQARRDQHCRRGVRPHWWMEL